MKARAQKNKLHNVIRCAHARGCGLLYFLYFYNIKMSLQGFIFTHKEGKMSAFVKLALCGQNGAVWWRVLNDIVTFT